MSIEKYVEQDFQALETSFSKGEPLSEVALPRILENISKIGDADRIFHWHEELRRIGGLPPQDQPALAQSLESVTDEIAAKAVAESLLPSERNLPTESELPSGGVGSL